MKPTFRKSMIWLHTYIGLFFGWLLFIIFLTGTLSYYNHEITHWMTGEKLTSHHQHKLVTHGLDTLVEQAPQATRWRIKLPDERGSQYSVSYRVNNKNYTQYLNADSLEQRDKHLTQGGGFFRTFHYTLAMRQWGGRYLAGIAAMGMLIAVFTGIYTHRRFFKDFFTIRRGEQKKFTIDFHAISGVVTIPFCLVICLSALLIYINMYQPFAIKHYFESYRALDREVSTKHLPLPNNGLLMQDKILFDTFIPTLEKQWGKDTKITTITVNNPRMANAQLIFTQSKHNLLSNKANSLAFTRESELLPKIENERTARNIRRVFYGLHEARFAEPSLRAMLFILGMISTLLIATGMVIWVQKRILKQAKTSYIYVEKINYAVFYGLSLSIAAYFLCSKVALGELSLISFDRIVFFYTWLLSLILCLLLKPLQGKNILLGTNVIAYLLLVVIMLMENIEKQISNENSLVALKNIGIPYVTVSSLILLTAIYFIVMCKREYYTGIAFNDNKVVQL